MRVVGEGHQWHPETGLCRRCGADINAPAALIRCEKAPPAQRPSSKVPNPYYDSRKL